MTGFAHHAGSRIAATSSRAHRWREAAALQVHAPPFAYNPSSWRQRIPISILAAIGAIMASYMALYQWGLISSVWDPVFGPGSERVLTSDTAKTMDSWLHVPDAAFGAWAYLTEAVLGLVGSTRRWQYRPWMVILFGIDVIPLGGVGAALVLMQGFVVGSFCFLCLCTAAISLLLIYLAYDEVWASLKYLYRVRKTTRSWHKTWLAFAGFGFDEAQRIAVPEEHAHTRASSHLQETR